MTSNVVPPIGVRGRALRVRFRQAMIAVAVTAMVMAPLAGCTFSESAPEAERSVSASSVPSADESSGGAAASAEEFDTFEHATSEYAAASDALGDSLPEGESFPSEMKGEWDEDGRYETGVGKMQAAFFWQCAWIDTYLAERAAGRDDEAKSALVMLESWVDLKEVAPRIDEATRKHWLDRYVGSARSGDDEKLVEYAASC